MVCYYCYSYLTNEKKVRMVCYKYYSYLANKPVSSMGQLYARSPNAMEIVLLHFKFTVMRMAFITLLSMHQEKDVIGILLCTVVSFSINIYC